jgi:hypothetical protein
MFEYKGVSDNTVILGKNGLEYPDWHEVAPEPDDSRWGCCLAAWACLRASLKFPQPVEGAYTES